MHERWSDTYYTVLKNVGYIYTSKKLIYQFQVVGNRKLKFDEVNYEQNK